MFVVLGLLVTPHELGDDVWPALVIGLVLTMVARPLSVVGSLAPFRVPWREQALMSWAGLRGGAVPIILATIPMVNGVDASRRIFNIVFVLVVVYTSSRGRPCPGWAAPCGWASRAEAARPRHRVGALERLQGHLLSVSIPEGLPDARRGGQRAAAAARRGRHLVVREEKSFVPLPTTVLRRGDELLVVATDPVRDAAERRLRGRPRRRWRAGWARTAAARAEGVFPTVHTPRKPRWRP